jgi:hypothetical protein
MLQKKTSPVVFVVAILSLLFSELHLHRINNIEEQLGESELLLWFYTSIESKLTVL